MDTQLSFGWQRDLPDVRDMHVGSHDVSEILKKSDPLKTARKASPGSIDLRAWCSPIEDQGNLGACTAHAAVGMYEYYERRAFGKHLDASRLFVYKVTRNLMGCAGDTGAYLRDTMKALVLFGLPPEQYWLYDINKFDVEPTAFLYSFAESYKALKYYRLDPAGTAPASVLQNIKTCLAAGLPSMFGFTVYSSIPPIGDGKGEIPFPTQGEKVLGGHAVLAVGYDDKKKIGSCIGAILIRNSWSENWGVTGYGWLPYDYVLSGLAVDWWSMVKADFINTDLFK